MLNSSILSLSRSDVFLIWALRLVAGVAGIIVLLILAFLWIEALPTLRVPGIVPFFTDTSWHPAEGLYNLTPMLWGSLFATAGAVLFAAPVGILLAVFCRYFAPPMLAWVYMRCIELLAGIPSVVYGLWGLMVLVPKINEIRAPGTSLLAGILILSLMILPTMTLAADASLSGVPMHYFRSAAALGLSRWITLRSVVFPSAKSGLFTGLILQTGRALGETMAILMVCGNVVQTPKSLFDPIRTLTANIALEMAYAMGSHRSALFVSGLVLMILIVALVVAADLLSRGRTHA